jgi:hypothetical protein
MKTLFTLLIVLFASASQAQEYRPFLNAAKDSAFQDKIKVAAYFGAKTNVANVSTDATVMRLSQIVLTEVTNENPSWLLPLSFVILTVPELAAITVNSTQAQINTVMNLAYTVFAKAWYKDIN